ncbi:MAG: SAM-dependent methyltransferase, partial [Mesorhizobium sp.]
MSPYNLHARFKAQYDANNQEFSISGVVRPQAIDELGPSLALLRDAIGRVRGVLYVNVRRLAQMNNAAFYAFS